EGSAAPAPVAGRLRSSHAADGIRACHVTGVQTCALPILRGQRTSRQGSFGEAAQRVGTQIPGNARRLGPDMGRVYPIPQVSERDKERGLYHKRDRVTEFPVTKDHQEQRAFPERRISIQASVSR